MGKELIEELRKAIRGGNIGPKLGTYYVGEHHFAKKSWDDKAMARGSFRVGKFAYENGVPVPRMDCVVRPDFFLTRGFRETALKDWYVVMERLKYPLVFEISRGQREKAKELWFEEVRKCLDLKISPGDCDNAENVLFDTGHEQIYFVDLNGWELGPPDKSRGYWRVLQGKEPLVW